MESISNRLSVAQLTPIKPPTPLKQFNGEIPEIRESSEEDLRRAREYSNTNHQSTVFEVGGKIVGSVGDNGSSTFYKREDSPGRIDRQLSVAEHINRLRKIYGNQLKVTTYPMGEGPLGKDVNRLAVGQSYRSINERV